MPEKGSEADVALRTTAVFEQWLERESLGTSEPFEELVSAHPDLKSSLENLRRMDGVLKEAMKHTAVEPVSEETRTKRLGDYKILREIGRGAMGIVFEAEQVSLRRNVALKVLPAHMTLDARALARFKREAEISAKLRHRSIIDIHQIGEVAGVHFIAMELVEGTSLDRVIERMRRESFESVRKHRIGDIVSIQGLEQEDALPGTEPAPPRPDSKRGSSSASDKNYIETAVKLIRRVADALQHAHEAGVIHRDIKPSNILVRPDGSPVLTDFGLAREEGLPALSLTGDFAGTPHYVSPEQAMSGRVPVDHRADIFSLGATLYELLTLELPFPGDNLHEVMSKIITKQPRDPAKLNPALAPDLVTIVLKALEKDPDRRYPSALALSEDLRAFIEYRPIHARRTPTLLRAWRWVKREPTKALLFAVLTVGIPIVLALGRDALVLRDTIAAQAVDTEEGELKKGFLDLGLRRHARAEERFRQMLAAAPRTEIADEVLAGLTFALLEQERASDALAMLESKPAPGSATIVSALRAEALLEDGQERRARLIDQQLAAPATAVEEYVAALRLLRGTTYEFAAGKDTVLQRRERAAMAVPLLDSASLTSDRALYYFALAGATWVAGDVDRAKVVARTIPRKWEDEALAWFYVGIAREVFDEQAAIEAYDRALELDPELDDATRRRGILLLERDPESGLEALTMRVDRNPGDDAGPLVDQAAAFFQLGRFEEAVVTARAALALAPDAVEALDTVGTASFQLGRFEEARQALLQALELEPEGARLHNDLGATLRALGQRELARTHLEQANQLDPEDPLCLLNLGWLFLDEGEFDRALTLFDQALDRNEKRPCRDLQVDVVWRGIGVASRDRQPEEALEAFQQAYRLAPADPGHALNLGAILYQLGYRAEAIAPLEQALAAGKNEGAAHAALVDCLTGSKRWPEALDAAVRWSEVHKDSAAAWNERAWVQVDPDGDPALRDADDGLRSARKAVELSGGGDLGMRDTLAWALLWSGQSEQALSEAREALELAPREQPEMVEPLRASLARLETAAASPTR